MPIQSHLIFPATKVRSEFTRLLPLVKGNQYLTLTYKGYPRAAVVDLQYLEKLEREELFNKAFQATSTMFAEYLKSIGKDIATISEDEANQIIWDLAKSKKRDKNSR